MKRPVQSLSITLAGFQSLAGTLLILCLFAFFNTSLCYGETGTEAEPPTEGEPIDVKVEVTKNLKLPFSGIDAEIESIPVRRIVTKSNNVYKVPDGPVTVEQQKAYDALTEQQREIFNQRRIGFLEHATNILNKVHLVPGFGLYAFDRVVHLFKKREGKKFTASQLGQRAIGKMLRGINAQMFDHTDVVVKSNEFGFRLSLGVEAGGGAGTKGIYHGLGAGIWIGYNHDKKEAIFDVFAEHDAWVNAYPAVGLAEVRAKALITARHHSEESRAIAEKKKLLLVALAAIQDNRETVEAGIKVGIGPMLVHSVYQELANRTLSLLGLSFSPKRAGFFRLHGAMASLVKEVLTSPFNLARYLRTGKWHAPTATVEEANTVEETSTAAASDCNFKKIAGK